jgi:hypothetical protein
MACGEMNVVGNFDSFEISPPPILSTNPETGKRHESLWQEVSREKGNRQPLPVDI